MDGEAIINRADNTLYIKYNEDRSQTDSSISSDIPLSMGCLFMTTYRLYYAGYPDPSKVLKTQN